MTIDQLAEFLDVPRSTIYKWVGDIRLPGSGPGGGFTPEARRRGNRSMRESRRQRREVRYLIGLETYASLSAEPAFRDFLISYLAAGKRSSEREVAFSHPDPEMMQLAGCWLGSYGQNQLRYRLNLPAGVDVDEARATWAERLGLEPTAIVVEPRTTASDGLARRARSPSAGTLRIASTDTLLRTELEAWIDCVLAEWDDATPEKSMPLESELGFGA